MLNRPPRPDNQEEERIFGTHPGDLGVIAIAALFTLALILILVLPSPFAQYERQQAAAEKAQRQKAIDKAVASGVVTVGIAPGKRH